MTWIRTLVAAVFIVSLGTAAMVPTGVPGSAGEARDEGDPMVQQTVGHFRWEAPPEYTGLLVTRIVFEPVAPDRCTFRAGAAYELDWDPPTQFWVKGPTGIYASLEWNYQVHANPLADTRTFFDVDGQRALAYGHTSQIDSSVEWYAGGLNLKAWSNPVTGDSPFFIEAHCDNEDVRVLELGGSQEILTFNEDSMQGIGASVKRPLYPDIPPVSANVQLLDRAGGTFHSANVLTDILVSAPGENQVGHLIYTHPEGSETHDLTGQEVFRMSETGGPGDYEVMFNRAFIGPNELTRGVIAGWDPVDHLDEIITPT